MKTYYPNLLNRQKAMELLDCTRNKLDKVIATGRVRTFKTDGGHNRYFRDDLTREYKIFKKQLTTNYNG